MQKLFQNEHAAASEMYGAVDSSMQQWVDFDEVAVRGLGTVVEVASRSGSVRTQHEGRFGRLRAEDATALSLVLTELVQNAVEHGFDGRDGVVAEVRVVEGGRIAEGDVIVVLE